MKANDKLSYDNYETVFFKLIEEEYSKKEQALILNEIKGDTFFSFEWDKWKKTKIQALPKDYKSEYKVFFDQLKLDVDLIAENPKRRIGALFIYKRIAIAAAMFFFVFLFLINNERASSFKPLAQESGIILTKVGIKARLQSREFLLGKKVNQQDTILERKQPPMAERRTVVIEENKNDIIADSTNGLVGEDDIHVKPVIAPMGASEREVELVSIHEPKRKFSFTVTKEKIKKKQYYTVRDLEETGVRLSELMSDKKFTLVREGSKLYLRLEKDENEVYFVSLDKRIINQ